jgi:TRAP-type C4-dicarboxylate transport system substrate-binding protein
MIVTVRRVLAAAALLAAMSQPTLAEENRLLLTSLSPAGSPNSTFFNAWAQRVNDASQGTLKVEVRDGATLANFGNSYDRVINDVVQIGWIQHAFVAGKFPLSEISNLPFMSDDNATCSVTLWRLYKSGLLDSEYTDVVPIWFGCLGQTGMHFAKPIRSNDNLGGLKLRVAGKVPSQLVERMGGTPVSMAAENMYESLQRGTIDGAVTSWSAFEPYKLLDVAFYHLEVPVGSTPSMFAMSKKKFESLPEAARKALMDNGREAQTRAFGVHIANQGERSRQPAATSDKHKIVQLDAAQQKVWEEKVALIRNEWAKERAGGDKAIEAFQSLYAQAKAGR